MDLAMPYTPQRAIRSAWGGLMDEIKDKIWPPDKRYPQLNFNTTLDVATLALLIGVTGWLFALRGDVEKQEYRIGTVEVGLRDLRTQFDATRLAQAQSDTKLEGRLVDMQGQLREILNRMAQAERDRRGSPPLP